MLYPSIDKLLNIVDSKYKLVHIASRRSKQMLENKHFQMNENEYKSKNTNHSFLHNSTPYYKIHLLITNSRT